VLALEGVNTAIEAVVDLASPQYHDLARRAKDVAAGAVLIAALGALIIAALIVLPRL
jgi:diacylglycerol kinase (ATP)